MATWTDIPNSSLESGAPARAIDATALRDNTIAITEGTAGAPKIQTAALNDLAVTAAKLATTEQMTTANVGTKIAGLTAYTVGSVTLAYYTNDPTLGISYNGQTSGANLWANDVNSGGLETIGITGSWRAIGSTEHYADRTKLRGQILWLRYA